jgi:rod shape-determining protein MreC
MIASARRSPRTLRPFFALFGIALFLLLARDTTPVMAAQSFAGRLLIPIENVVSGIGSGISSVFSAIAELDRLRSENERLRSQVEQLTLDNVLLREQTTAAEQIAKLDKVAATLPYASVVAEKGLVGRVTQVYATYSRVLPVTDSASAIVATAQRSRASGIVRGVFGETLTLEWVLQNEDLAAGDVVITAGLALSDQVRSLFPKGLVIGTVSSVQKADVQAYQKAVLTPAVDFRKLERVLVVKSR